MSQNIIGSYKLLSETTLILFAPGHRSMVAIVICAIALTIATAVRAQLPSDGGPAAEQSTQGEPQVSLEYFRERLSPYGQWLDHPAWGEVWRPDVGDDFRPYFDGYWEYTSDAGSLWISNEPFGDIVYHYGRWVFDRANGWLWVPGFIWAPSWVVWRANNDYVGWLPMPPGYLDYQQLLTSPYLADRWYGYFTFYGPLYGPTFITEHYFTLWVFVLKDDLIYRHGVRHVSDIRTLRSLYYGSTDQTDYVVDQDRVVDRSIDRGVWQRGGDRIAGARPAREHLRADARRVSVSRGRDIDRQHAEDRDIRSPAQQRAENRGGHAPGARRVPGQDSASPADAERKRPGATTIEAGAGLRERSTAGSRNAPERSRARTPIANPAEAKTISNEPSLDGSVALPRARGLGRPDRPSTDRQPAGGVARSIAPVAIPRLSTPLSTTMPRTATSAPRPITPLGSTTRPVTGPAASTSVVSRTSTSAASAPAASSAPAVPVPAARSSTRSSVSRSGIGGGATRGSQGRGF